MIVCSLLLTYWRALFAVGLGFFYLVALFCMALSCLLGTQLRQSGTAKWLSGRGRRLLRIVLVVAIAAVVWAIWVRYRWNGLAEGAEGDAPQPWPYPDEMLVNFHDWLNARNPPPPGYLKLHGEIQVVSLLINLVAWALCSLVAGLLGLLWPRFAPTISRSSSDGC